MVRPGFTNQLSLNYLRREVKLKHVGVCQRMRGPRSEDLFGFLDVMAMNGGKLLGVQACTSSDYREHIRKLDKINQDTSAVFEFLRSSDFQIHIWRRLKTKGVPGRGLKWTVKVVDVLPLQSDIQSEHVYASDERVFAGDDPKQKENHDPDDQDQTG